jgi:hypothetical protein
MLVQIVFEAIKQLLSEEEKPKKKIGFTVKEKQAKFGHGGKVGIDSIRNPRETPEK